MPEKRLQRTRDNYQTEKKLTDRQIMQQIMQILGPEPVTHCDGCHAEQSAVLKLLRDAGISWLGPSQPRPNHDPVAEAKGNEEVPWYGTHVDGYSGHE